MHFKYIFIIFTLLFDAIYYALFRVGQNFLSKAITISFSFHLVVPMADFSALRDLYRVQGVCVSLILHNNPVVFATFILFIS